MSQPFILTITDNVEEVSFLSNGYQVMDGGFDIGLAQAKRDLALVRTGFYQIAVNNYKFREAKIRFAVRGDSRSDVLERLHKIERILRQINNRVRPLTGRRGQLSYAWDGSTDVTYFEIYGGDLSFPGDVLSVAKIHAIVGGQYLIPDCELSLQLSTYGYGISIYSADPEEVPLWNPNVVDKTTGGVTVANLSVDATEQYNYVEIQAEDIPGSQPAITKILLDTGANYQRWQALYMGLQVDPFPTDSNLMLDSDDIVFSVGGSNVADADSEGGYYKSITYGTRVAHSFFSALAWSVPELTGMFYGFAHCKAIPDGSSFAIGIDDYTEFGIRYQEDYVEPNGDLLSVPLGAIQLPPTGYDITTLGSIHPDLWLGLWYMLDNGSGGTLGVDALSLLPITNGLRVLRTRVSHSTAGTFYDDGWSGVQAFKASSGGAVSGPFYGLLNNLMLEPGVTQRIYFTSIGGSNFVWDKQRDFSVRVYAVPTYLTLAM